MAPQNSAVGRIFILLIPTIIIAILNSYIPHEYAAIRQALSYFQLALMAAIVFVTIRFVLEDF
jgi:hypothetical protein